MTRLIVLSQWPRTLIKAAHLLDNYLGGIFTWWSWRGGIIESEFSDLVLDSGPTQNFRYN